MPRGDFWKPWQERLAEGGAIDQESGCVEWTKAKNSRGYGVIYFDGKLHLAHRAAWLERYGSLPERPMVLDHVCNNKACINTNHLRELPNHPNIRRAYPRGDEATERKRKKWRAADARRRNYYYTEGGE